jgi:hypothetical protein
MLAINRMGTGCESGKRIVPLLISYGARSSLNAARRRSVLGLTADPEPADAVGRLRSQGAVRRSYADRMEALDPLEVEGGT